jgi:hypothetical protein
MEGKMDASCEYYRPLALQFLHSYCRFCEWSEEGVQRCPLYETHTQSDLPYCYVANAIRQGNNVDGRCTHPKHPAIMTLEEAVLEAL